MNIDTVEPMDGGGYLHFIHLKIQGIILDISTDVTHGERAAVTVYLDQTRYDTGVTPAYYGRDTVKPVRR